MTKVPDDWMLKERDWVGFAQCLVNQALRIPHLRETTMKLVELIMGGNYENK